MIDSTHRARSAMACKKTFSINSKFKKAYIRKLTNDNNPKARRSSHVALKKAWEIKPPMLSYITIIANG